MKKLFDLYVGTPAEETGEPTKEELFQLLFHCSSSSEYQVPESELIHHIGAWYSSSHLTMIPTHYFSFGQFLSCMILTVAEESLLKLNMDFTLQISCINFDEQFISTICHGVKHC